jgi:small subunit ribosomal protein S16
MLAIKLQRIGKKHQPSYRVVVAEKRSKLIAPPVEDLGSYSATTKQASLKADRVSYWLGVGAQPTVTVHNLLVKEGVLKAGTLAVKMKRKETSAEAAAPAATTPATQEPAAVPAEPAA